MTSIIYFLFLLAPYAIILILGYQNIDIGYILVQSDMNFWLKFLVCFASFVAFYLVIRFCINYFNGGIKRKIFFPISFILVVAILVTFLVLFKKDIIDNFLFDTWTVVFFIYSAVVELFALTTTFIRTFVDGRYHCPECDRFRADLMLDYDIAKQRMSYDKKVSELHSYQKYRNTTVTTEVTATGRYGGQVNLDVKQSSHDNYDTEYYTTSKNVTKNVTITSGTVVCQKCGGHGYYGDFEHHY